MAGKTSYSFELATNTPTGVWKIAERTFWNRQLTMAEKKRCWAGGADVPILAAALTTLKVEGDDLTAEWVEEHLTERDLSMAFAYILGGSEAVAKLLAGNG